MPRIKNNEIILKELIQNQTPREEFIRTAIMNEMPIRELADMLYDYMKLNVQRNGEIVQKTPPIRISQEQFKAFFKIIGYTADGKEEMRGRKKTE